MTSKSTTIFYATGNNGKFEEVATYIEQQKIPINLKQFRCNIEEIQSLDQQKIIFDKAQKAWQQIKHPFLIEDAAIFFDNYNKFPGTMARFVWDGLGFEGIKKLFAPGDKAHFCTYLVYTHNQESHKLFEGTCSGTLKQTKVFDSHPQLPYFSIFIPDGATKTYAQLRRENQGQEFNHRLKAFDKYLQWFFKKEQ